MKWAGGGVGVAAGRAEQAWWEGGMRDEISTKYFIHILFFFLAFYFHSIWFRNEPRLR